MDAATLEYIKRCIRENMVPYFDDEDIDFYYKKNGGDINDTIYELLIVKAEDSAVSLPGYYTGNTEDYFKNLASKYRRYNSGALNGA